MPSDAKKKRDLAKKQAAKTKGGKPPKAVDLQNGDGDQEDQEEVAATNGHSNGLENGKAENGQEENGVNGNVVDSELDEMVKREELLCQKMEKEARLNSEARACTGNFALHPKSRDIKLEMLSITFYGREIIVDAKLELNTGRRYGLVGLNGTGKSTLLAVIGNREVPIPDHIDIFLVDREMPASDKTALQCVMEVDEERVRLEALADQLISCEDEESQEQLMDVYDRLDEISADTAEVRAAAILCGLGFTHDMQNKKCKDFSGGWRMRVALARALYLKPSLLLLDEPTNHLDLEACVWLE